MDNTDKTDNMNSLDDNSRHKQGNSQDDSSARSSTSLRIDNPSPSALRPRPVLLGDSPPWTDRLIREDGERPTACLYNAILALSESPVWLDHLAFDEASQQVILIRSPFWRDQDHWKPRPWIDDDDIQATCWLQSQCRIMTSAAITSQAVESVARRNPFSPVCDYLRSLHWDGLTRIDSWLSDYMGVSYSEISSAFGSRFLISSVARAFIPGCKVDTSLFLEGAQGVYKSTALSILAGEDWFTDELPDIRDKDSAIQLQGKWIVELGEIGAFHGVPVSRINQFLSRSTDRFRPPYGRRAIDVPRRCVFVGTVNSSVYLQDETGARRFWPVRVGDMIDIDNLSLARDHLWAEAVHRFRLPRPASCWWLETKALNQLASSEQADRYQIDPWQSLVERWSGGRQSVSNDEIFEYALGKSPEDCDVKAEKRIGKILRFLKWERYQRRLPDGRREWRYRNPDWDDDND